MTIRKLILIGVMLITSVAPAFGMIIEFTLDRMVEDSQIIVQGRVVDTRSHWSDGPTNIIVTDITFAVDEVLMGDDLDGLIELQVIGGEVGEVGMRVEHQPNFRPREEAVLFLEMSPDQARWFKVFNDEQGKYSVVGSTVYSFKRQAIPLSDFRDRINQSKQRHGR